jgi:hypothetical protein
MAIKFECPKCGRRFVDWGAEKYGYKCPNCLKDKGDDVDLQRVGAGEEGTPKRSSLKRSVRRTAVAPAVPLDEDEALVPDMEALDSGDSSVGDGEVEDLDDSEQEGEEEGAETAATHDSEEEAEVDDDREEEDEEEVIEDISPGGGDVLEEDWNT